jgi:hypothetical protein
LLVRSAAKARAGWNQTFEQMHRHGDDRDTTACVFTISRRRLR